MSELEKSELLIQLVQTVAVLVEKVDTLSKRMDKMDAKLDEGKKRVMDKWVFPVLVTLSTTLIIGLVVLVYKVTAYMDAITIGARP